MQYEFKEPTVGAKFRLIINESNYQRNFFEEQEDLLLSLAWNTGDTQKVIIDEIEMDFPKNSFLSLMVNQSFRFEKPQDVVLWQYNREFYCIVDHDKEVSCAGFLFYGVSGSLLIELSEVEIRKFTLLLEVFKDEFQYRDNIQGEMLRMLLKRLIIILTRLGKEQYLSKSIENNEYDLVREYSLLVENNFKKHHQVQDYANMLNKSPKTLSNLFSKHHHKTPLQIIRDRIFLEGKRLLIYTDKTSSEIAYDLGFDEPAHFSRFFKKMNGQSPSEFKTEVKDS
ncbi:MAG: helix-turn-helix domain-containing protein [Saprospiraceae bacterium]|jgi:AraC-like DNA-binding protein|nr:helix-turn-helix domain-containing protein [Saprospiraceae bacterium]